MGHIDSAGYFSVTAKKLLNQFLTGQSNLDGSAIEQILLPSKAYSLYKSTDDLRRSFELQLDREASRISEDIDAFVRCIYNLFEEIKKLLVSKVKHLEFDFRESLTSYSQRVERYLKESYLALVEDKKKNQYFTMKAPFDGIGSYDDEMAEMSRQRKSLEMTDRAYKIIRNYRKEHRVLELADSIDLSIRTEQNVYNRSQFRRLFKDLRDEIIRQVEEMELTKDDNIVKSPTAMFPKPSAHPFDPMDGSSVGTRLDFSYRPQFKGEAVRPNSQKLFPARLDIDSQLGRSSVNDSHDTINSVQTNERPINQKISSNPQARPSMTALKLKFPEESRIGRETLNESLAMAGIRKQAIEERERAFRERTKNPMWQSKDHFAPQAPPPANEDDNSSWKFLGSITKKFFSKD
jgi:hypothetical protein